jgi:hypothetical protein
VLTSTARIRYANLKVLGGRYEPRINKVIQGLPGDGMSGQTVVAVVVGDLHCHLSGEGLAYREESVLRIRCVHLEDKPLTLVVYRGS